MKTLSSQINSKSEDFKFNAAHLQAIVISEPAVAEEYRRQFDAMWGIAND